MTDSFLTLLATGDPGGFSWGWLVLGGVLAILLAILFVCWRWPMALVRSLLWLIRHTIYRLRVTGQENIPATGGALLVCNHVTYLDWLWLLAAQKRFIRFVIFAPYANAWGVRHLLRWAGVIPIDSQAGPRAIVTALRAAGAALARGELVAIFAEGALTRTGFMLPFHRGFEQILKHTPVPIIPVCLDHAWGSIFSYHGGKLFWKWPLELPYPVSIAFGRALPPDTKAAEVRLTIQKLSADCAIERSRNRRPVHRQFVRMACSHPFRVCFFNPGEAVPVLNYGKALAGAMCLAKVLRGIVGERPPRSPQMECVGLWLPASVGGALANIALTLLGKTTVNLNYTAPPAAIEFAIRQCGIRHVVTSRRFTDKLKLEVPPGVELIYLEDLRPRISKWQWLGTYLAVILLPGSVVERMVLKLGKHKPSDVATVIFSSGSTGEPKGVVLTHGNISANSESMIQAVALQKDDRALGILPFFHSFGYTVTLWVPLQIGASLVYHPDPRQAREIGELCRKYQCTIFLATPTFLRFCLKRCEPGDFATVRILICGAEKLSPSLAEQFREKFGVLPLEGYGCTELSPVAAANVPDVVIDGFKQVCNKPGTIGQPLPGIAARVVDPETLAPLPIGQEGLLLIYGPNVMRGYLGREDLTRQVIRDGWYVTGDMAKIDEDGFITLTGRLSRFAKVGGEMVPLERIEEELHQVLETADRLCAVTSVPDEKKGERVVVLHLPLNGTNPRQLSQKLSNRGMPNLWVPGPADFLQVEELPLLGSGKVDLKRLKELAVERTRNNGT